MIYLVDKEVEEEEIAQHSQAHPDTALPTISPRESLIVGVYVYLWGCLPKGAHLSPLWSSLGEGVFPMWSSLGSHVPCILRECNEPTSISFSKKLAVV